jgi:uncharacterized protein YhfF
MTLPPIDPAAVDDLWRDYCASADVAADITFTDVFHFGDHPRLADELLGLVLEGRKRATATGLAELERANLPTPRVGDHWIVCDGRSRPRVVGVTTDVRIGPLQSVDDAFAWDEGEGDRTRDDWLRQHDLYFRRTYAAAGLDYDDNIDVVFERFDIVYQRPA